MRFPRDFSEDPENRWIIRGALVVLVVCAAIILLTSCATRQSDYWSGVAAGTGHTLERPPHPLPRPGDY